MAAVSSMLIGVAVAGAAVSAGSSVMQAKARKEATQASQRAERLREEQMRLESLRRQRELIRQQQVARSTALARSVGQGAGQGEDASSSLFGAYGQIAGAYGRASNADLQNADIGAGIFAANRDLASAQGSISTWEGVGSFGGSMMNNSMQIAQIGSTLWNGTRDPWEATVTRG